MKSRAPDSDQAPRPHHPPLDLFTPDPLAGSPGGDPLGWPFVECALSSIMKPGVMCFDLGALPNSGIILSYNDDVVKAMLPNSLGWSL